MNPSQQAQITGFFQLAAALASLGLLLIVLDLVRRRRLFERYAILWLLSALVLIGLSVWRQALDVLSTKVLGIAYPPTAVFLIALGFVLVLLLHFSVAVSRLSDQSKVLAQRLALLEERLREVSQEQEPARSRPKPVPVATHSGEGSPDPLAREPVRAAARRPPAG